MQTFAKIEPAFKLLIRVLCSSLLVAMVVFTCYTVVMRYVFLKPPFWGDTLTLFANVWLVMLALVLSTRDKSQIAMQMVYNLLPARAVNLLELIWTAVIVTLGLLLAWYGFKVAMRVPGMFWELGYLPKTYPMMIMPISGALVAAAGVVILVEDIHLLLKGEDLERKEF